MSRRRQRKQATLRRLVVSNQTISGYSIPCWACNGVGMWPNERTICGQCHGAGFFPDHSHVRRQSVSTPIQDKPEDRQDKQERDRQTGWAGRLWARGLEAKDSGRLGARHQPARPRLVRLSGLLPAKARLLDLGLGLLVAGLVTGLAVLWIILLGGCTHYSQQMANGPIVVTADEWQLSSLGLGLVLGSLGLLAGLVIWATRPSKRK